MKLFRILSLVLIAISLATSSVSITTQQYAFAVDQNTERRTDLGRYPAYLKKLDADLKAKKISQSQYNDLKTQAVKRQVELNTAREALNNYRNNPPTTPEDKQRMAELQKTVDQKRKELDGSPADQANDLPAPKIKTDLSQQNGSQSQASTGTGTASTTKTQTKNSKDDKKEDKNVVQQGEAEVRIPNLIKNRLLPGKKIESNDFKDYYVDTLLTRIIKLMSSTTAIISLLFIIYGSYNLLNPLSEDQYESAKKIIFASIVGLFLSLFAYAIVSIIASINFR